MLISLKDENLKKMVSTICSGWDYNVNSVHCEKNNAGSPKTGQNYRLFVKKLGIFRRKCEVHDIRWYLQTIPKRLRNICKNCNENHVTFCKISVLLWLCILHVKYLENVTGISHTITIFNTRNLKVQTMLYDFQHCLQTCILK